LGKFKPSENNGAAVIGFKHEAITVNKFEILIGAQSALHWVRAQGKLGAEDLRGARPVEGGREDNNSALYIARARAGDDIIPGKASQVLDGAYVTVHDSEKKVEDYEVLVYN